MDSGKINTLDWLSPDLLVQFMDELRDAGYNIGLSQYIAVQDLLLTLIAQKKLDDLGQLKTFIGPVLCSSATEQLDFQQRFEQWVNDVKAKHYQPLQKAEQQAKVLEEKLSSLQQGARRLKRILIGTVTVFTVVLFHIPTPQENISIPDDDVSQPTTEPTTTPIPDQLSTNSEPSPPAKVGAESPVLIAPDPPDSILDNQGTQLNWLLYWGVVTTSLLIWRFWWDWRARLFLNRRESNRSPELKKISMQGLETAVFSSNLIFKAAQQLRQRTRQLANTLDISHTIQASLKKGGWFTPIYGYRQVIPEYLFLIDRASYADHQAKLTEELIQLLQQNGVYITRYFFDGDAQICYPEAQTNLPQPLAALSNQYGADRLVMIADAEILYSRQTGEPEPWLEQLQAWEQRAILTPKPVENWGQWEFKLVQQFVVLPLSDSGIAALSQVFRNGSAIYRFAGEAPPPLPEILSIRPQRWLERHPPIPEQGQIMLKELNKYLGESGIYWFTACAVFPELHWNITVYLGNVLKTPRGRSLLDSYTLTNLTRLPWFRYGYIPDWLRQYLVVNLTPDQNKTIHRAFRQLMVTAVQGSVGPLQLNIAQKYQQSLPNLTNPLLRLIARQAPEDAPLRDYIFLEFMTRESLLTVEIPEDIQPLLQGSRYEKVLRRQRLVVAAVVGFITAAITFNTWWMVTAQTRRMAQLLQITQTLVTENRRLEALIKLTEVGQMLRASKRQNSSVCKCLFKPLTVASTERPR